MGKVRIGGFTLIEVVVTLALVGVLALVTVPLYEVTTRHLKESELRTALREIRTALDAYKDASDHGLIPKDVGASGYPPDLQVLVEGVEPVAATTTPAPTFSSSIASYEADTVSKRVVFLRQIPRDPFFPDQSVAPDQQWDLRSYGSPPGDFEPGDDVYDVSSRSTEIGLNGIPYKDW